MAINRSNEQEYRGILNGEECWKLFGDEISNEQVMKMVEESRTILNSFREKK
jgi:hypothetical protein